MACMLGMHIPYRAAQRIFRTETFRDTVNGYGTGVFVDVADGIYFT